MTPTDSSQASTICAPATPLGGAIAVIRLSGADTMKIADSIFTPTSGHPLSERKGYTIARGTITDDEGNTIDDVLASVFRSPHSYTGEDCIELSCHASPYIVQRVITLLCRAGCRMAEPGEFTRRAFLNGKMDLSQAEAVADLIAATSAAEHHTAMNQMRGAFSKKLADLREQLLRLTSLMELELDFTDHEDLTFADRSELQQLSSDIARTVGGLALSFKTGDAIRRGIAVTIIGETNTGKSTLLNALSGDDRAIVSDVHGTTRDTIEDNVYINGVHFRFIDTAGIRHTDDIIETLGIERSYKAIAGADIVIILLDATKLSSATNTEVQSRKTYPNTELANEKQASHASASPQEKALYKDLARRIDGKKVIVALNKCDLLEGDIFSSRLTAEAHDLLSAPSSVPEQSPVVRISAKQGTNIEALKHRLVQLAAIPEISTGDVVVTNARHYQALTAAAEDIKRVHAALDEGTPTDLVCEDLRLCLHHLAEITGGEITSQETLNNIFARFCVGK